jgi:hypothetical protein
MVNVMFDHINRFKDAPLEFIRSQMQDFFGLDDGQLESDLTEEELMKFYREQLKLKCHIKLAADLTNSIISCDSLQLKLKHNSSSYSRLASRPWGCAKSQACCTADRSSSSPQVVLLVSEVSTDQLVDGHSRVYQSVVENRRRQCDTGLSTATLLEKICVDVGHDLFV